MTGRLYLEFCGEDHTVRPGDTLTFGRSGDLEIDDNPYLHRHLGRFVDVGGVWHLENLGRHIPLHVRDQASASSSVVAPGGRGGIVHGEFVCAFRAGPTQYELTGALETHEWATDLLGPAGLEGAETVDWGRVELNDDQRLLLLAMCERRLMDPHDTERPLTNGEGAARLGWSVTKFNRKLDQARVQSLANEQSFTGLLARGTHFLACSRPRPGGSRPGHQSGNALHLLPRAGGLFSFGPTCTRTPSGRSLLRCLAWPASS